MKNLGALLNRRSPWVRLEAVRKVYPVVMNA